MRKRITRALLGAAVLITAAGITAIPAAAHAATSFNVTNPNSNGSFTGTAGATTLTDTGTGAAISCTSSTVPGTMHSASGLSTANGINDQNYAGGVTGGSFSGCSGPGGSFTVDGSDQSWSVYATSYNSSTGQMAVDVYIPADLPINVSGPNCSYSLAGTLTGAYTNSPAGLAVNGGSLTVSGASGSGCGGLAANGDTVTLSASYSVTPAVTISPDPPTLAGDWAPFNRCPVEDPSMLAADGSNTSATCNVSDSPGGSIKIGNSTVTTGDSNLQFGLLSTSNKYTIVSPSGGALVAAPVQIPGGLLGLMCPSGIPAVSLLCQEAIGLLNNVTAAVQPAGNPSNFSLSAGISSGQPILTLPVKIQLQNPLLGSSCYIGSDSNPIVLHPENTTAPSSSLETFDPNGTPDPSGIMASIVLSGATQGDNTFAAPGASGCGPLGVADVAVNLKEGLPSSSGNNSLVLSNATTHALGGFEFPSAQSPNEGQNLATDWNSAVEP